ncbi:L-aspartate oxidase [Paenibacillus sp. S25]|uniref:L-aspartate oxidase n=1 Tax=Paenibacillus sp. S25 TaxID=2823905 RepID=UPI001C65197F|nr:L-aspartate oxidase [Paenibacillus sp. S25]QYK59796.1 L-aspartate oxidase [Paenibacillus sp. S25]
MIPRYLVDFDVAELTRLEADVLIIGSGIAGLYTAIKAAENRKVLLITKKALMESNTRYAQGGIAAVTSDEDTPAYHMEDTLIAGAGLCECEAVSTLVHEGPVGIQELIRLGTAFDRVEGDLALTREGAHSHRRILHANGDATGYEIVRALSKQVAAHPGIEVWEECMVIDLLTEHGECIGALVQNPGGERSYITANATILCSGGSGQLYRYTTNPDIATGDGIAMAYRAGAIVRDMEFIQFHPTALCHPGAPRFLISEAVRGEGAVLRNIHGERFMDKYDSRQELAPRDIVARAIIHEMERTQAAFVYLDITHEPPERVKQRFPTIYRTCLSFGLDMTTDWIPIAPAAHYMMGGVQTNLHGESCIARLFACGETSSTGVHGANRLASNSLSEAIVFASRIIERLHSLPPLVGHTLISYSDNRTEFPASSVAEQRHKLQEAMVRYAGVRRHGEGLQAALDELQGQMPIFEGVIAGREEIEFANLLTCALLVTDGALLREESRGAHYREDFPETDDSVWRKHVQQRREQGITEEYVHDI